MKKLVVLTFMVISIIMLVISIKVFTIWAFIALIGSIIFKLGKEVYEEFPL